MTGYVRSLMTKLRRQEDEPLPAAELTRPEALREAADLLVIISTMSLEGQQAMIASTLQRVHEQGYGAGINRAAAILRRYA